MDDRKLDHEGNAILDALAPSARKDWAQGAGDPFSMLRHTGNAMSDAASRDKRAASTDALEQLQREAEAVLRNPELASTYVPLEAPRGDKASAMAAADRSSLTAHALPESGTLLDMFTGPARVDNLIGSLESLDAQQLLSRPPMPDVLQLFAGDIAPLERRRLTAALTRREHHLVSMDSSYQPAPSPAYPSDAYDN